MASGNITVTVGYDKKSLRELRKFAKKIQKCHETLVGIRERMDKLTLKRLPKEGRPYVTGRMRSDE